MPKKSKPAKRQSKGVTGVECRVTRKTEGVSGDTCQVTGKTKPLYRRTAPKAATVDSGRATADFSHPHLLAPSHFTLREDGTIGAPVSDPACCGNAAGRAGSETGAPPAILITDHLSLTTPRLAFTDPARGIWLYHGNSLELLDAIAAKYPAGRFDAIFADPPYFLSNGGITCHAGKMVKVDKGDWDVLARTGTEPRIQHRMAATLSARAKPNGTIWQN